MLSQFTLPFTRLGRTSNKVILAQSPALCMLNFSHPLSVNSFFLLLCPKMSDHLQSTAFTEPCIGTKSQQATGSANNIITVTSRTTPARNFKLCKILRVFQLKANLRFL